LDRHPGGFLSSGCWAPPFGRKHPPPPPPSDENSFDLDSMRGVLYLRTDTAQNVHRPSLAKSRTICCHCSSKTFLGCSLCYKPKSKSMHSSSQIEQNGINSHAQDTNNFRPGVHKVPPPKKKKFKRHLKIVGASRLTL